MTVAALDLDLRGLAALLMVEHLQEGHHSKLCHVCQRAHELGIRPTPLDSDTSVMAEIHRRSNAEEDGYFGCFSSDKGGAR